MRKSEFINHLAELLEKDPEIVTGDAVLDELGWDSMSVIAFIAFADEKLSVSLKGSQLSKCQTVNDLALLVKDKVED
jgi:acyl carrier protein